MGGVKELARLAARSGLAITAAVSVLMLFGRWSALIETTTNFRPHMLLVTLPLVAVAGVLGDRRDLLAGLIPIGILSISTVPYLFGSPPPVPPDALTARVMQYNVLFFNDDTDAMIAEIIAADADVVALHEVTTAHWRTLEPALQDEFPYAHALPAGRGPRDSRGGGKAILSRTPLEPVRLRSALRSPPLAARVQMHGHEVLAIALHPSPARTDEWLIDQRNDKMATAVRAVEQHAGPAMIITDLNIAPTSPDYGRFIDDLGWVDPRKDIGIEPTFPATGWAAPFGIAIDHVLVSPELTVHDYELGDGGGSDHHSLVATVSFPRVG